jgi:hypothetical protein
MALKHRAAKVKMVHKGIGVCENWTMGNNLRERKQQEKKGRGSPTMCAIIRMSDWLNLAFLGYANGPYSPQNGQ